VEESEDGVEFDEILNLKQPSDEMENQQFEDPEPQQLQPQQRKSTRNSSVEKDKKKDREFWKLTNGLAFSAEENNSQEEPNNYKEAMESQEKEKWQIAIDAEKKSLQEMKTWSVVDRPKNKPIVKCRWVFKLKRNQDGAVIRHKARLVAKGYTQTKGVDFNETFAPVLRTETLRYLISYATAENLEIHNMDVETAFLNGDLEEEIYMEMPEGFEDNPGKVCKLNKTLYGLKQSAREWNMKFVNEMKAKSFDFYKAPPIHASFSKRAEKSS
jgi:hypothetical protein